MKWKELLKNRPKKGGTMMLNNVRIKQTTKEIILSVNMQTESQQIIQELEEKLPKLKEFYQNSNVPMRVTGKLFTEADRKIIEKMIIEEIKVEVKFDEPSDLLGLHAIKKTFEIDTEISETKYIYNSIRSGMKEEFVGSIVICGDVHSGAEIVAGGNIIVLGTLRGVVHSGANGNNKAIIAANTIEATQIRISNLVKEVTEKEERCPIFGIKNDAIELLEN